MITRRFLILAALLPSLGAPPRGAVLGVRDTHGTWVTWWRAQDAPARWTAADPVVSGALEWREGTSGVRWAELELAGSGEAWRTRVVVARIDPHRIALSLANGAAPDGGVGTWTIDAAPPEAAVAFNAGQFSGGAVWGWVVHDGMEYRAPGAGPLASAVIIDSAGNVTFENDASVAARRSRGAPEHPAGVRDAFQSYPTLLESDGDVPRLLRETTGLIDLEHRDARLAIGQMADGTIVVVLTRFNALGTSLGGIPFGLTIPETAALMGALGCRRAVALDGGVSAQLRIAGADGAVYAWHGLRRVPLALVAEPMSR